MIYGKHKNFYDEIFGLESASRPKYKSTHWSIAWSDLMMTMFILFAVMYMYLSANSNLDFGNGPGNSRISDLDSGVLIDSDSMELIEKSFPEIYDLKFEKLKQIANIELASDRAVRIILANDLLFEPGKTALTISAKKALSEIATALRKTPYLVNISGHSDNRPVNNGQFPSNWELSAVRACTVTRFFTETARIPERRFFVSGYSSLAPVATNDTREGRAANRRVEILITKDGQRYYYE